MCVAPSERQASVWAIHSSGGTYLHPTVPRSLPTRAPFLPPQCNHAGGRRLRASCRLVVPMETTRRPHERSCAALRPPLVPSPCSLSWSSCFPAPHQRSSIVANHSAPQISAAWNRSLSIVSEERVNVECDPSQPNR